MEADTQKAKEYLEKHGLTCVLCRGEELVTSDRRGVQPLLELLDSGKTCGVFVPRTRWWAEPRRFCTACWAFVPFGQEL